MRLGSSDVCTGVLVAGALAVRLGSSDVGAFGTPERGRGTRMGAGLGGSSLEAGFGLMWGIPFRGGGRGPEKAGKGRGSTSESLSDSKGEHDIIIKTMPSFHFVVRSTFQSGAAFVALWLSASFLIRLLLPFHLVSLLPSLLPRLWHTLGSQQFLGCWWEGGR